MCSTYLLHFRDVDDDSWQDFWLIGYCIMAVKWSRGVSVVNERVREDKSYKDYTRCINVTNTWCKPNIIYHSL